MKARSKRPFRKFLKAFWGGRRADAEGLLTSPTLASFFVPLPLHWSDDDRPDDQPEATWGTCKEIMWAEGIVVDDETFTISFTFLSANAAPIGYMMVSCLPDGSWKPVTTAGPAWVTMPKGETIAYLKAT